MVQHGCGVTEIYIADDEAQRRRYSLHKIPMDVGNVA